MRRRLFGRSADSALSFGNSRASPVPSPTARDTPDRDFKDKDSVKEGKERDRDSRDSASLGSRHARAKKSVDGGKDRLSIFGGSFSNTIKGRKPPPRYAKFHCMQYHVLINAHAVQVMMLLQRELVNSVCRDCMGQAFARFPRHRATHCPPLLALPRRMPLIPSRGCQIRIATRRRNTRPSGSALFLLLVPAALTPAPSSPVRLMERHLISRKARISLNKSESPISLDGCARRVTGTTLGSLATSS